MQPGGSIRTVFYDMRSDFEFFNSDPLIIYAIDLRSVESSVKNIKYIYCYKLPRFMANDFVINIHREEDDFVHVESILTYYLARTNMEFLTSKTGSKVNHSGYIFFDQHTNIEIGVNKYMESISKKDALYTLKLKGVT